MFALDEVKDDVRGYTYNFILTDKNTMVANFQATWVFWLIIL